MRRWMVLAASIAVVLVGVSASTTVPQTQAATQGRWVIRDLGTLGGTNSMVGEKGTAVEAINERGQVIGTSNTGPGHKHGFLWQDGKMRDLGTLGGQWSEPVAINDRGQAVGTSGTTAKSTFAGHAFLWEGRMRDLGTLGSNSWASDINERGQVVGRGNMKQAAAAHPFLWEKGSMRDLGTLPGGDGIAFAEANNDRGQVIGLSEWNGFLWQRGEMRDLGACWPRAINSRGHVVGGGGFLWRNGKMIDLHVPGRYSDAVDINERDQVVGSLVWTARGPNRAFLWQTGKLHMLGTLGGKWSVAADINERGQVVGHSGTKSGLKHAFLWRNGEMTDLGTLPGGDRSEAVDINERGQIVGWSETRSGKTHAVLWTYKP